MGGREVECTADNVHTANTPPPSLHRRKRGPAGPKCVPASCAPCNRQHALDRPIRQRTTSSRRRCHTANLCGRTTRDACESAGASGNGHASASANVCACARAVSRAERGSRWAPMPPWRASCAPPPPSDPQWARSHTPRRRRWRQSDVSARQMSSRRVLWVLASGKSAAWARPS